MSSSRPRIHIGSAACLLVAGVVALPILAIPALALFPAENIWPHLASTVLPRYVGNTLALLALVGTLTLLLGVSCAWLVSMCRFPGRRLFSWALLLPLAMPAYVIAFVYTDLLEYAGPLQQGLRALFDWQRPADYWFPEIRSLGGAAAMLALVLYPYVYLMARSAFLEQSVAALDVSRTLGCGPWGSFLRVALPSARPAIVVGVSLALMETLADFGTVDFFGVATLSLGVYDVWLNMGNLGGAAQVATVMLAFVAGLIIAEQASRRRAQVYSVKGRLQALPQTPLRGWRAAAASGLCASLLVLGFVLPASVLGGYAIDHFEASWTPALRALARNSVLLSASGALLTVCVATLLVYARRLRPGRLIDIAVRTASLGYALPGAVLAIGVIIPLTTVDRGIDALSHAWFGTGTGLLLSGSVFAIIFAYTVRFLAVAVGGVRASLDKVTPSMDMAARTLGHGPWGTFVAVHLPLIRGGMLTGAVIVFVDCMKELPATLILRPFNFDTLATHVYQFASDERIELAALAALGIVAVGLAPVLLLTRTIAGTRAARSLAAVPPRPPLAGLGGEPA